MSDKPELKLEQEPGGGLKLVDVNEAPPAKDPKDGALSGGTDPEIKATPDPPPGSPPDFKSTEEYQLLSRELEEYKSKATRLEESMSSQPKYDDYLKAVIDTYQQGGDLSPYLKAASLDADSMSSDAAILEEMKLKFGSNMSAEDVKVLFDHEKRNAGFVEGADEDALRIADINWKAKATASKAAIKASLSKYKKPEFNKDQAMSYYAKQLEDYYVEKAGTMAAQQKEVVMGDEGTQKFIQDKGFTIKHVGGDGKETEVNVAVGNPYKLVDMAVDNNKFWELFTEPTASGESRTNIMKFFKVAMYAQDPEGFEKLLINAAAGKAKEDILDTLENPDIGDKGGSSTSTPGDEIEGFAKALLEQHGRK